MDLLGRGRGLKAVTCIMDWNPSVSHGGLTHESHWQRPMVMWSYCDGIFLDKAVKAFCGYAMIIGLAQLEKEVELQRAKNKALSLNPAAKVEEKQFETNIENMINSIRTLSLPVPTRSENINLFFQSLERAFLTKKINDEYKSEILINLLGERAHNVLLYINEEELNDYEKLKSIVLREFQLTPRECLNSFKNAVKSSGETYIQFAARLTANFQYYCSLRKVNSFESLCDLIISDKLFETLNKETATHIGIREAEDWFRPIDLAKECDIYISSRSRSQRNSYYLWIYPRPL
ncbi:DUF1758 domain-containing protein [Trichonephila clavipes]|nr:DUF1758 domain-containing protein [Trichonephila clavipes]